MKFLIASDIHGSAFWCEKIMQYIQQEQPDKVVLLGDLLYHGPRNPLPDGHAPMKVAEMLNSISNKIIAVRGNCDAEIDQMVLNFPCVADYTVLFDGKKQLYCTHGHLWNPDNLPPLAEGSAFLHGHFHVSVLEEKDGITIVNPGSVALPKDDQHSFVLYEGGKFKLRTL